MKENWATSDFELSPSKQTSNDHISDGAQSCIIIVFCVLSGLEPQPFLLLKKTTTFQVKKNQNKFFLESQIF